MIDAETYLYKAAEAASYEVEWEPDCWRLECNHKDAKAAFSDQVKELEEVVVIAGPTVEKIVLCFGDGQSFRHQHYPAYKSHRRNLRRPPGYKQLLEWAKESWVSAWIPGLEGDDVIGVVVKSDDRYEDVVCSTDKDLRQLSGWHVVDGELRYVTYAEASRWLLTQWLCGDPADGYPGCPGVGPKTAEKLLDGLGYEAGFGAVMKQYLKKGISIEDAMDQLHCARILRSWDLARRLAFSEPPFNDRH